MPTSVFVGPYLDEPDLIQHRVHVVVNRSYSHTKVSLPFVWIVILVRIYPHIDSRKRNECAGFWHLLTRLEASFPNILGGVFEDSLVGLHPLDILENLLDRLPRPI